MTPRVSVIIVTHNSAADLERCLLALPDAAGGLPFDVVVADAKSTDRTAEVARSSTRSLILLEMENRGFAAAANHGAARATGEILLFLNPDALLPPESLPRLISHFLHERIAAASGLLVNVKGNPEAFGERFPSLGWYIRRRVPTLSTINYQLSAPQSVPFLSGTALLVRRGSFWRAGGFHEDFFLYYEDIDLSRRLRERGGVLLLDPTVRILHHGGHSAPLKERVALSDRAEDVYFSRHRPWWEGVVLRGLRRAFRAFVPSVHPLIIGLPLAAIVGVAVGRYGDILSGIAGTALAAALVVLTARVPDAGILLLLGSLLFGQLVRIPLGAVAELTVTDAFLPLVLGGWLLALFKRPSGAMRRWPLTVGVIAVLGVLAALLPGLLLAAERLSAAEWLTALAYAGRLVLALALLPLAGLVTRRRSLAVMGVLVVGSLLALLGFLQLGVFPSHNPSAIVSATCARLSFLPCPLTGWDPHLGRLFSTWLDPNLLGGFFVMAIAVLTGVPRTPFEARLLTGRTARSAAKMFLLAAGALLVLALVLTKSRTSLLALAVVAGASLLTFRSWRRWFPLATAAALGVFLVPSFAARLQSFSAADPTASLRLQSWGQALEQFSRFPLFGAGYNAYGFEQLAAGNIGSLTLHSRAGADNSFLTLGATTGIWGVMLLFLLLNALFWTLLRRWRRDPPAYRLLPIALSAFIALLAHAQFVHSLVYVHLLVPLVLLLSGTLGPNNGRQEHPA